MNIHIIPHGKDTNNIMNGINYYSAIDKVYLLTGETFSDISQTVKNQLKNIGIKSEIKIINPFDYNNIVYAIMGIAIKHKKDNIFINATGGTNLMAGAAITTSFFIGATSYYVLDSRFVKGSIEDLIVQVPTPKQPLYQNVSKTQRKIMEQLMKKNNTVNSISILCKKLKINPQKMHYHIKKLNEKGLINEIPSGRKKEIEITNAGKLFLKWTL